MALDPVPTDLVSGACHVQPLPEIIILYGLAIGRSPVPCLPAVYPLRDAIHHIFAVCVELYGTGSVEGLQGHYGSHEFHTIVGCQNIAALNLLCSPPRLQDCAPAPRAGIALAGTVSVDDDWGQDRYLAHGLGMGPRPLGVGDDRSV